MNPHHRFKSATQPCTEQAINTAQRKRNWTSEIAEIVARTGYESLDARTVEAVKRLIADGIAVAIAGSHETAPRIIAEHVRETRAKEEASVWSYGYRTSAQQAAYCNAASMHVLDFEPMSSPPTHAVSPTVPAAALLDGRVAVDTFTDARRFSADMEALLAKIRVVRDATRSRDTREMQVDMEVVTKDGATHRSTCTAPPGTWGQPIDPVQHEAKVRDCLAVRLNEQTQTRVLERLATLETLSADDLRGLLALLA